jgi:predicted alpha-1,6-mannanase (GH76 family)
MVDMYDLTGDAEYLKISMLDEAYMYQYWNSSKCGGGLIQSIRENVYINAISNELYIQLAAALHNRLAKAANTTLNTGQTDYLARAEAAWTWFVNSGMINDGSLVNDGLVDATCTNNGGTVWTYNQGVVLAAAVELHAATGDAAYLIQARAISDAVLHSSMLNTVVDGSGVLTESCEHDRSCNGDQQMFKGIFARSVMRLDAVLDDHPYRPWIQRNAATAYTRARSAGDLYDVAWTGPFGNSSIAKQASAVSLLVSLL